MFKNGNEVNNGQSATFSNVEVSNSAGTVYNDSFSGPGLTANIDWQVAEYYQYAADRVVWFPENVAYWLKWNTTAIGWSALSSANVAGPYSDAGVTYTVIDGTGTNTLGAVPIGSLPAGNAGFFEIMHP